MEKIDFSPGTAFVLKGIDYEIKKQIDMEHVLAKNMVTYREEVLPLKSIIDGELEKSRDRLEDIRDQDWDEAKRRLEIIQPILDGDLGKEEVIMIAKKNNVHFTTLYRWCKKYKNEGVLQSLVPNVKQRGPKGHIRIEQVSELITKNAIETLYLTKQKLPVNAVYREIVKRCRNADVKAPHINTVRNRIKQLSNEHVVAKRESRQIADRQYRNTDGVFPEGTFPLDVIQIDHTPMDIILVDEIERKPIGRPYLTLAIDVYSRMVTGFYIALEAPSYFSVSQCLSQSILTKERYLQKIDVQGSWKIWGVPKSIAVDNAAEFRSKDLQRFCEQYGIPYTRSRDAMQVCNSPESAP